MNDKINIYDLSENRINQAIENLTKFHKDKIQTFSDSLDVNLEIALQLIEKQQAEIEDLKLKIQTQKELLKMKTREIEKKDKIIDLMAEELVKAHEWFYSEFDNYTKEDFIKYFENKAEEDK